MVYKVGDIVRVLSTTDLFDIAVEVGYGYKCDLRLKDGSVFLAEMHEFAGEYAVVRKVMESKNSKCIGYYLLTINDRNLQYIFTDLMLSD